MMNPAILSNDTLKTLAATTGDCCITVAIPTEQSGDAVQKNPIAFKNRLQDIGRKMEKIGMDEQKAKAALRPFYDLYDDYGFWQHQDKGLVAFAAGDFFECYKLPFAVPKIAIIDKRFYLRDILPEISKARDFAVLLLNEEGTCIKTGHLGSKELQVLCPEEKLRSFERFLSDYVFETSPQPFPQQTGNAHLQEFLKQVENWVYETFYKMPGTALFYIADEKIDGLYHKQMRGSHPQLYRLSQYNTRSLTDRDIVERVEAHFDNRDTVHETDPAALLSQSRSAGGNTVLYDFAKIVNAAKDKRIDTLFIANDFHKEIWGTVENGGVQKDRKFDDIGEELVNFAVTNTFLNGGGICPLADSGRGDVQIAALCRW